MAGWVFAIYEARNVSQWRFGEGSFLVASPPGVSVETTVSYRNSSRK